MEELVVTFLTDRDYRWDELSMKFYNTSIEGSKIREANPFLPRRFYCPMGFQINIPLIPEVEDIEDLIPPWKKDD